jgi:hypothetical protein
MRYWWLNIGKALEWLEQGYIWAPQTNAAGKPEWHCQILTEIAPQDSIIAYRSNLFLALGQAISRAEICDRPIDNFYYGRVPNVNGWRVPVEWRRLDKPVSIDAVHQIIAPLAGVKYSPLNKDGVPKNITMAAIPQQIGDLLSQALA